MNIRYIIIMTLLGLLSVGCTIIDDTPYGDAPYEDIPSEEERPETSLDMEPEDGSI